MLVPLGTHMLVKVGSAPVRPARSAPLCRTTGTFF
jgi:hypothetical protein